MRNALVLAKQKDFDVFNALDIMENESYLKELKFGIGDGNLHYYFYNWRVPELKPAQLGVVLVWELDIFTYLYSSSKIKSNI